MPVALAALVLGRVLRLLILDQTAALAASGALFDAAVHPAACGDGDNLVATCGGRSGEKGRVAIHNGRSLLPCELSVFIRDDVVRLTATVQSQQEPLLLLDRPAAMILWEALEDAGVNCRAGEH